MTTNNTTNIQENSKSSLGMPLGTRKSCLMKKTGDEKSHDAVPLKQVKLGSAVMVLVWMRMLALMALLWGGAGNGGASDDRASDSRDQ